MSEPTLGQAEDARAFLQMRAEWLLKMGDAPPRRRIAEEIAMRWAWNAAIQRGLSLRGCCHDALRDT